MNEAGLKRQHKTEWQRESRRKFQEQHGFSTASNYANGGIRLQVLKRDNFSCVKCGMTDAQHKEKWGRPITVDHIDKDRKNNTLENLRALCLSCHGKKDQSPWIKLQKGPIYKSEILKMRAEGKTYQEISNHLDMSIATVWQWFKKWEGEK